MRRSRLALAAVVAVAASMTLVPASLAIGPGGWDHVGHGSTTTSASLNGRVSALNTQRAGYLYAGGTFTNAGGIASADFLAVWDGVSWQPVCNSPNRPAFVGNVDALQIIGNTIYVGGEFQDGAELPTADYLLACDLTTGASSSLFVTDGQFSGSVYALTAIGTTLYAGGNFGNLAQIPAADYVAAYSAGGGWQAMGAGAGPSGGAVTGMVRSLTASGTKVYVGTDALDVAGIAQADHVARWDTSTLAWSALGANTATTNGWFPTTAYIYALGASGSLVFAGGSFQDANGTATADMIAYFDGTTWRPIGSNGAGNGPLPAEAHALKVFGGKLYAGGNFTSAGGDARAKFLAAYALRLPDNAISLYPGSDYVGGGVYSTTGLGQARTASIRKGAGDNFYVRVQNDGLVPTTFKIKATGGASGITANNFHRVGSTTNITSAIRAGTYTTPTIAPNGTIVIAFRVLVKTVSAAAATFVVTTRSAAGTAPDAVRAKVTTHR